MKLWTRHFVFFCFDLNSSFIEIEFVYHASNTHLKCTVHWFLVSSQICTTVPKSIREHFYYLRQKSLCFRYHSPVPPLFWLPSPRQPLIYFLSLWTCLFWTFLINGIIEYRAFCVWLPFLSIVFSRFICVLV